MNVLVIGSGGREHALVWKIRQSKRVDKIFCAPGNGGIASLAECVDISATDVDGLLGFAKENDIGLTVVGPEASLVVGIVDTFEAAGLRIFGPTARAAILEGSKVFTKEFLKKYNIPTADFAVFTDQDEAKNYIDRVGAPVVVKADGLAAGKGVIVAKTVEEAKRGVDLIMQDRAFGEAGDKVVVEQCLVGEEASFIAFTDGKTVLPLPTSQDHKAVFENDEGPNTGGMGAYSPAPVVTDEIADYVMEKIMIPTVKGLAAEGRPYKGMLYAGLMIDGNDINVLEFNCRFGDPEAQPLLMRVKSDIVDVMEATIDTTLDKVEMVIDPKPTVCVVMASGGYPASYDKGYEIRGLESAASEDSVIVFHAGTAAKDGKIVNQGGRVLGVTAAGYDLKQAIDRAYRTVNKISWSGCYFRRDIGQKALRRMEGDDDRPLVGIVMGSVSDWPVMQATTEFFKKVGVSYEVTVASAHRTPERTADYARTAEERGLKVIIAGAGMAAHLAGVLAAQTTLPVVGVPLSASALNGFDSLLSTAQMPPGVPVATMGIGKAGAVNSAIFALKILSLMDDNLHKELLKYRDEMIRAVEEASASLDA